jgi:hypothetical protein
LFCLTKKITGLVIKKNLKYWLNNIYLLVWYSSKWKVVNANCMVTLPAVGNTLHCAVHHGTEPALLDVVRGVVEADVQVAGVQAEGPSVRTQSCSCCGLLLPTSEMA